MRFYFLITPSLFSHPSLLRPRAPRYIWFLAFTALWHIFVYCPLAHWFFYFKGWMYTYGAVDFAGGMVVHTASGVSAFVLTFWLGRSKVENRPHNVPYVLLGAALLWFGWLSFNAGSALSANTLAARAFVNTQYAAAVGMMTWNVLEVIFGATWGTGSPTAVGAACGVVSGLVGITPAAGFVSNMWAFFFGFFTALCVFFVPKAVKLAGIDDRLDCFAFHGVGGIVGSLLTGLFAARKEGSTVDGAFYFNQPLFGTQIAAVLVTVLFSVVTTTIIYWLLWAVAKAVGTELTLPAGEQATADVSQHGERAYYKGKGDVAAFEDGAAAAPKAAEPKAAEPKAAAPKAAAHKVGAPVSFAPAIV